MSDALQRPPTFNEMVGLIEQNFKDVLRYSTAPTPERIEKAWERYKTLNHLYQDKALHPSESAGVNAVWVKATKENMRRSAILRDQVLHENHIHQWRISAWNEIGVWFGNGILKEWWELEILVESPSLAPDQSGKEDAVAFMNWTLEGDCQYSCTDENQWTNINDPLDSITTSQLYDIFKQKNK